MSDKQTANLTSPAAPRMVVRAKPGPIGRVSRSRARVREFLRPDNLREFLSTLALVAPLTILVWVWAEREQAVEVPVKKPFAIAVRATNPTKTVALAPGQSDTIVVEMSGPRAGIEGIKDAIATDSSKGRLMIDIGENYEPGGPYAIVLETILDQQKFFADYGVSVTATEPASVSVVVDREVERDIPIRLPAEIADGVQTSTFEPKSVKVRGPERTIKQLEAGNALRAELDLTNLGELRGRGGSKPIDLPAVPLRPIDAPGVSFDIATGIKVTLQLSQEEQLDLKPVVVFVNKPAGLKVTETVTPLVLNGVKVIGPTDALRQLRDGKVVPQAVVTITRDDLGKQGQRMPTISNLPPGVRVVETSVPMVAFDVSEATASGDFTPMP